MLVEGFLRRLPIIRRDGDHAVGAGRFGVAGKVHRLIGARHADMDDDRHAAGGHFDRGFGQKLALVERQIQRFGEVQVDAQRCRVLPEQKFDDASKGVEIDLVVRCEGRHRNMNDAPRNGR